MPDRVIQFEGKSYQFPADATDDEISQALAAGHDQGPPNAGLAGVARPDNPILRDSHNPRSPVYQDSPFHESTSAENLGGYVDTGPIEMGRGAINIGKGNFARGGHQVISGGMTTAAPAMIPLAATAPLHAATALVGGGVGGKLMKSMAEKSGLNPDQSEFAGDIGNVVGGYGGAEATSPGIRGMGSLVKRIGGMPDLPTNIPSAPMTNFLLKAMNASKSGIGQVGRRMANYGIPQAPNIAPGPGGSTYPDPELPSIRPDQSSHYNDVSDQGETNRLLDSISEYRTPPKSSPDPVRPSGQPNYDDVTIANPSIESASDEDLMSRVMHGGAVLPSADAAKDVNSLDLIDRVQRGAVLPSAQAARTVNSLPTSSPSPFADAVPTPNSNTLLRAIQSAPGWPENGQPNVDNELLHAMDTDPYNRQPDQSIQTPNYSGPERRQMSRPGLAETTAASDPSGDAAALTQARSELPNGSLSDHLQRAAQIAAKNRTKQ